MSARVSVLLPLYKANPAHLREALGDLFAQTFTDWEAILLEQPTGDDVTPHIAEFLKDKRLRLIKSDTLRSIGANWNACLEQAEGDLIAYLFHDDRWEPTYLQRMAAALDAAESAGFAVAHRTYVFEGTATDRAVYDEVLKAQGQMLSPGPQPGLEFLRRWLQRGLRPNVIGEPSFVVLRRRLMDEVGPFDESMVQVLDSEYWVRCLRAGDWVYVPECLGRFRVHDEATTARNEREGRGSYERLELLERLTDSAPPVADWARAALGLALEQMVDRFLAKLWSGRNVGGVGGGGLKRILRDHPWLALRAVLRWPIRQFWRP